MAQFISKIATLELAKTLAQKNPDLQSKTAHDLEAITWDDRNRYITVETNKVWSILMAEGGVDGKHQAAFFEAYMVAMSAIWSAKVNTLQRERRNFLHTLSQGIDSEAGEITLRELVESFHLRGMQPLSDPTFGLTVAVPRGTEDATVYFRFDRDNSTSVANPDVMGQRVGVYTMNVQISWGGTSRSIESAMTAATLYRELTEMAAEVVSTMSRVSIIWKRGF